jgi:mannitol 2-dehydrogenase
VLSDGDASWGITGVGILERDGKMYEALKPQDYLYTLVAKGVSKTELRVVGSIIHYVYGAKEIGSVLKKMSDASTRIISLTVTEEGYCYNSETREIDMDHPGIIHDLKNPDSPITIIGCLAKTLSVMKTSQRTAPTILSCDNIPHNGEVLKKILVDFSHQYDPDLSRFIEEKVCFPCTMVDRITPMTTKENKLELETEYGLHDNWPVFCEEFRQWIIEDNFSLGAPDWTIGGAQFVSDVIPYENMKIRMLNGAHMALSHCAFLAGFKEVREAMGNRAFLQFVKGFLNEVIPTVGIVPGVDLNKYAESLIERFSNPALRDQIFRLTIDSSKKIPNMLHLSLQDLLEDGKKARHIAFANAAWIKFSEGSDESGGQIPIEDSQAERLKQAADECRSNAVPFLSLKGIFPRVAVEDHVYVRRVSLYLHEIRKYGVRKALDDFLNKKEEGV